MRMISRCVLLLVAFVVAPPLALAQSSGAERSLVAAMTPNRALDGRMLEPGTAIREYIAAGLVGRRPDRRMDYVDYRVLRGPATLLGHDLLVLEEEYMERYVGCCVNPGIGAILRLRGDPSGLTAFATHNRCTIDRDRAFIQRQLRELALPPLGGDLVSLSCRENDLRGR